MEAIEAILQYIMSNYAWFLGSTIIVLLAIIGSYADKTNFGQGKPKETETEKLMKLENKTLQEHLEEMQKKQEEDSADEEEVEEVNQEPIVETSVEEENYEQNIEFTPADEVIEQETTTLEHYEEKYAEFDKHFDELLPEKGFDDGDLLDEIESISLDKTQKIDITEIPDLDDVDLPRIKSLATVDEDVWKF